MFLTRSCGLGMGGSSSWLLRTWITWSMSWSRYSYFFDTAIGFTTQFFLYFWPFVPVALLTFCGGCLAMARVVIVVQRSKHCSCNHPFIMKMLPLGAILGEHWMIHLQAPSVRKLCQFFQVLHNSFFSRTTSFRASCDGLPGFNQAVLSTYCGVGFSCSQCGNTVEYPHLCLFATWWMTDVHLSLRRSESPLLNLRGWTPPEVVRNWANPDPQILTLFAISLLRELLDDWFWHMPQVKPVLYFSLFHVALYLWVAICCQSLDM